MAGVAAGQYLRQAAQVTRYLVERLHPSGTTSRRSYGEATLGVFALLGWLIVASQASLIPDWFAIALLLPASVAQFLLTIRRLRDAGLSVYWAGLMICPFRITIGDWSMQFGFAEFRPFDLIGLLAFVLFLVVLVAPTRERRHDTGEPTADAPV